MSTLWCCPSSIFSANHSVVHPPWYPEEWFRRGCCGIWHAWTMQVSFSWLCQKRFLWTHKEVDVAPHPVVDLLGSLKRGAPQAVSLGCLDSPLHIFNQYHAYRTTANWNWGLQVNYHKIHSEQSNNIRHKFQPLRNPQCQGQDQMFCE